MGKYECFHYNPKLFYLMAEGFLQTVLDATDTTSERLKEVLEEIDAKYLKDADKDDQMQQEIEDSA